MHKYCTYFLLFSLLANVLGLFILYKAYDYRKKMILAWAQSHEWASEFQARDPGQADAAEGIDLVLLGASITAHWDPAGLLAGRRIVNKGIDGQYASQLLLRFQHDVIDLHPRAVVIKFCEMNFSHSIPAVITRDNMKMISALAEANGIRPLVATVIPVTAAADAASQGAINRQIHAFNDWLREWAAGKKYTVVDFAAAMSDAQGALRPELTRDGVHPVEPGYAVMSQTLRQILEKEGI